MRYSCLKYFYHVLGFFVSKSGVFFKTSVATVHVQHGRGPQLQFAAVIIAKIGVVV